MVALFVATLCLSAVLTAPTTEAEVDDSTSAAPRSFVPDAINNKFLCPQNCKAQGLCEGALNDKGVCECDTTKKAPCNSAFLPDSATPPAAIADFLKGFGEQPTPAAA